MRPTGRCLKEKKVCKSQLAGCKKLPSIIPTFSAISCVHNHEIDIFLVRNTSHMRHERNIVPEIG